MSDENYLSLPRYVINNTNSQTYFTTNPDSFSFSDQSLDSLGPGQSHFKVEPTRVLDLPSYERCFLQGDLVKFTNLGDQNISGTTSPDLS